jgi:hypothetical protein
MRSCSTKRFRRQLLLGRRIGFWAIGLDYYDVRDQGYIDTSKLSFALFGIRIDHNLHTFSSSSR